MKSSTLKTIGTILFAVAGVGGLFMMVGLSAVNQLGMGFIYFLIMLFCGFLSYSIFAAFAQIIEQNDKLNVEIKNIINQIKALPTENVSVQTPQKNDSTDTTHAPVNQNSDRIKCPKCGKVQPAGRKQCWDCGMKFVD